MSGLMLRYRQIGAKYFHRKAGKEIEWYWGDKIKLESFLL
jgi:hypothetical protein